MRMTVLGACGAWPEPGDACSGFLIQHDGFNLVLDLGYATFPRLIQRVDATAIDAAFISHGHPDHCVDLNPLLRARALRSDPPRPLQVYALPNALDAVLRLDRPGMLDDAYRLDEVFPGSDLNIGPFRAATRMLPHFTPNVGIRLEALDGVSLAYTGDCGPSPAVVELARDVDLLLADASYIDDVPDDSSAYLTSARRAAEQATAARAKALMLTHLMPGTDRAAAVATARRHHGNVRIATSGMVVELD